MEIVIWCEVIFFSLKHYIENYMQKKIDCNRFKLKYHNFVAITWKETNSHKKDWMKNAYQIDF